MTLSKALSIFGLKYNYTEEEVKKIYLNLMKQCHPDRFERESQEKKEEMTKKTQEINEAYEFLKKNLTNQQQQYTYENASTYWSEQCYQGYGYYKTEKNYSNERQKREIKERISKYCIQCPSEKLVYEVSDLLLEYIMKIEKSDNPNLIFNEFQRALKKIYMEYIEIYAKKHNIPLFKIKQENFNYDCDCAKLFNQLKSCETIIGNDLSKIIKENQYHIHFDILKQRILKEKKRIREKINYDTTLNDYLGILNEYEKNIEKIISDYSDKYNEFKLLLDKTSYLFTNQIKEKIYENLKLITLNATIDDFKVIIKNAIEESLTKNENDSITIQTENPSEPLKMDSQDDYNKKIPKR